MSSIPDPVVLVDQLEPEAIRQRIAELDRQSRALRVLLRAAVARERAASQGQAETLPSIPPAEGHHAG
jgi:hypothetical protein